MLIIAFETKIQHTGVVCVKYVTVHLKNFTSAKHLRPVTVSSLGMWNTRTRQNSNILYTLEPNIYIHVYNSIWCLRLFVQGFPPATIARPPPLFSEKCWYNGTFTRSTRPMYMKMYVNQPFEALDFRIHLVFNQIDDGRGRRRRTALISLCRQTIT